MNPERPTQNRITWMRLLILLISLLCLYYKSMKDNQEELKRWQVQQQARQEAEEQIYLQADATRRMVNEAIRPRPKEVKDGHRNDTGRSR